MFFFIGGAPRIGKSLIAKKFADAEQATLISTDEVDERYVKTLSKLDRERLFPMPNFSGTPSHNALEPMERVRMQMVTASSLELELKRVVLETVQISHQAVVEGIHITPSLVDKIKEQYPDQMVKAIFIGSQNQKLIIDGVKKNTNPHNWLKDSPEEIIRQVAQFVVSFSSFIQQEARTHLMDYFERTDDFERDKKQIFDMLDH